MADNGDKGKLEVQLTGKDPKLFQKFYQTFKDKLNSFLDMQLDKHSGATIREELQEYIHLGNNYLKAHLKRPDLENAKIKAEVQNLYFEAMKKKYEGDVAKEEARAKKFKQDLRDMKFFMLLAKDGVFDEQAANDGDIVFFTKNADTFLQALKEMESEGK